MAKKKQKTPPGDITTLTLIAFGLAFFLMSALGAGVTTLTCQQGEPSAGVDCQLDNYRGLGLVNIGQTRLIGVQSASVVQKSETVTATDDRGKSETRTVTYKVVMLQPQGESLGGFHLEAVDRLNAFIDSKESQLTIRHSNWTLGMLGLSLGSLLLAPSLLFWLSTKEIGRPWLSSKKRRWVAAGLFVVVISLGSTALHLYSSTESFTSSDWVALSITGLFAVIGMGLILRGLRLAPSD